MFGGGGSVCGTYIQSTFGGGYWENPCDSCFEFEPSLTEANTVTSCHRPAHLGAQMAKDLVVGMGFALRCEEPAHDEQPAQLKHSHRARVRAPPGRRSARQVVCDWSGICDDFI